MIRLSEFLRYSLSPNDDKMLNFQGNCRLCGKTINFEVKENEWNEYLRGELIQRALKSNSNNEREFILSQICNECFDKLIPTENE